MTALSARPVAQPVERPSAPLASLDSSWYSLPSPRLPPHQPPTDADELPALQDRLATALSVLAIVGAWAWLAVFVASH